MILHHVPQTARLVIIAAAPSLHAQVFRAGDLHMINEAVVPQRLEHGIGKAQHHDVLCRLLAKIVINAVGIRFLECLVGGGIQGLCGRKIGPKRLFDDNPRPFPGRG